MDKLKNSGFYKLRFFITPEEFKSLLQLLEHRQAQFIVPMLPEQSMIIIRCTRSIRRSISILWQEKREMTSIPSLFTLFLLHRIKKVQDFL